MLFGKFVPMGALLRLARIGRGFRAAGLCAMALAVVLGCVMGCAGGKDSGVAEGNVSVETYEHFVPGGENVANAADGTGSPSPDEVALAMMEQVIAGDFVAACLGGGTSFDGVSGDGDGGDGGDEPLLEVGYEVHCLTEEYISFTVTRRGRYAPNWGQILAYNLDGTTGRTLSLTDIFGEDFATVIWEGIGEEVAAVQTRFSDHEVAASLIYETRPFYIDGEYAVILFDGGEIAPETEGVFEFPLSLPAK